MNKKMLENLRNVILDEFANNRTEIREMFSINNAETGEDKFFGFVILNNGMVHIDNYNLVTDELEETVLEFSIEELNADENCDMLMEKFGLMF